MGEAPEVFVDGSNDGSEYTDVVLIPFPGDVLMSWSGEEMLTRLAPVMGIGTAVATLAGTVAKNVIGGCEPGGSDVIGSAVTPGGKLAKLTAFAPTGRAEMSGKELSMLPAAGWTIFPVDGLVGETSAFLGNNERKPGADEC